MYSTVHFCLLSFIVPTPDVIISISPNPVETGMTTNITCTVMLMNPSQYQSGEVLIQLLMGDTVIKSSTTSVNSNSMLTLSNVFSTTNTSNGGIYNCTANVSHTNDNVLDSSTGENSKALTVQSELIHFISYHGYMQYSYIYFSCSFTASS